MEAPKTLDMTYAIAKPSKINRKYFRPLQAHLNSRLRSLVRLVFMILPFLRIKFCDKLPETKKRMREAEASVATVVVIAIDRLLTKTY
ncbi:hypothetical protein NUACC21_46660 [Scytonema sp. NUACC21]